MIAAAPCPGPAFNVAGASGFYAQMTGLLAGFAFAAIVVLLTPTQNAEREIIEHHSEQGSDDSQANITRVELKANDNGVMSALLAAFFALLIATLTYSVLAGETLPQSLGRAATEELVDGVPFGLAVMMLFHGLTVLMDNGNISKIAMWLSRLVAVVVAPILTFYYLTNGATDTASARFAEQAPKAICSGAAPLPPLGIVLAIILTAILVVSLTIGRRINKIRARMKKLQAVPPITVVGISVGTAILGGFLNTRSDNFLMSPLILNWYLVGTSAALAFIGMILAIGGGRDRAATERQNSEAEASSHDAKAL